jgi:hypothetical protein
MKLLIGTPSKYSLLLAFGLAVLLAVSTTASADSIVYNVSGTFSNYQQLTGQVTWNSTLSTVTNSVLSLSDSTFNSACSSAKGGCGGVLAGFWGTGSFSNTYEILVGGLGPKDSIFELTLVNGSGIKFLDTTLSWSRVAVPDEPLGADLLIVLGAFALAVGPATRFRKSDI